MPCQRYMLGGCKDSYSKDLLERGAVRIGLSEEIVRLTNVADRVIPSLISHGTPLTNPVLQDKVEEKVFFSCLKVKKKKGSLFGSCAYNGTRGEN